MCSCDTTQADSTTPSMRPLTVVATLYSPPVVTYPLHLDACLLYGLGCQMGRDAGKWVEQETVEAAPLPLKRINGPDGLWWWASSSVAPWGREACSYAHRRPMIEQAARWSNAKSINIASGPDKSLRAPIYYRPEMRRLVWTCVGDIEKIAHLLSYVSGVGHRVTHGWGVIARWTVTEGGPDLDRYAWDVSLRHLPVQAARDLPEYVNRRRICLRAPYYRTDQAVPCWEIPRYRMVTLD